MGRDRLGFELAREFDLRTIGLLYYVAASSETLVEAVQRIERFSAVGNEAMVFRCGKGADLAIRLDYSGVARHSDRHQTEFFLTTLVRLCRSLTGMPLTPLSVTISHARSEGPAEYGRFFGCQPEFAAPPTLSCSGMNVAGCRSSVPILISLTFWWATARRHWRRGEAGPAARFGLPSRT